MVTQVQKKYNALLPVEWQDEGEKQFDQADATKLQFKQKNPQLDQRYCEGKGCCHGSKIKSQVHLETHHQESQADIQCAIIKLKIIKKDKLLKERQIVEFKAHRLQVEEQYAKSRARVDVLEDLE